jgi:hypothetical protein
MGKIAKAMQGWLKSYRGSTGPHALKYIETGDPAALGRLGPSPNLWEGWTYSLPGVLADPGAMGDEDRRALHVLAAIESFDRIGEWLSKALGRAKGDESLHDLVREELASVNVPAVRVSAMTVAYVPNLARAGRPNSAGRHLLALPDADLSAAVQRAGALGHGWARTAALPRLAEFLLDFAPERLGPLIPAMELEPGLAEAILRKGADRYEPAIADAWRKVKGQAERFMIGQVLAKHDRERYGREMLEIARAVLGDNQRVHIHDDAGIWMLQNFGAKVLDEFVAYLGRTAESGVPEYVRGRIMSEAVKVLGARALPAVLATIRTPDAQVHFEALSRLVDFDDGAYGLRIQAELERRLTGMEGLAQSIHGTSLADALVGTINLAARWRPAALADQFWELLGHRLRPVREAAARALGRLGGEVVPRAAAMLADRKADRRAAAVTVLATVGTPQALEAIENRLDEEPDDDVRDAMLLALDAARAAAGREIAREEIDRRIQRTAPKLKESVAAWLDESRLPALLDRDGNPFGPQATRYLLFRQSRAKEIRPDIEARPLYERIDRTTRGPFALEVLRQFAASKADAKDRWALAIAGLLGDDRVVPTLNQMIQSWAESSRGKMAEYAVQALALLGTDAALMSVDAAAIRYRTKNKNIGAAAQEAFAAAAERLGLTADELGDRVVPWLGFEPGRLRVIEAGGKRIEVAIGPDFKLKYRDLEKNKAIASLPKSLPKETLAEFKDMGMTLRDVAKAQKLRLEALMVRQHRWPVARWRELFLDHPVLFLPFATRLVWGHYDEAGALTRTFRALEDRTLTDAADASFDLPDTGLIGIVHPLELDDEALGTWRAHLADYEVEPPFPQLERPVIRASDERRDVRISRDLAGTSLNAMTFRGRAEKLGWARGSVTDAGCVDAYRKVFTGAGVEAFLELEGMYIGIGMDDSIQLGDYYFVKGGTVQIGSYVYDNPGDEGDPRLIPFGAVPPVVFSEVVGDLRRIAGQSAEEGSDAED